MFHGTDKLLHGYLPIYTKHFRLIRTRKLRMLEIGIGGYSDPNIGGASLRMWKAFFPHSEILGADLHAKIGLDEPRIRTFLLDQANVESLQTLRDEVGQLDIIVDDGSHINSHVLLTFETLFPVVRPGGFYCVEDVQTSYWEEYGGDANDHANRNTVMGYFREAADALNYPYFRRSSPPVSSMLKFVMGVHFYRNLIIIEKSKESVFS
jgi:hypothetical protein